MAKLTLTVVSQDKELLSATVEAVTAPTQAGEVTILPYHVPLFSPLQTGELRYKLDGKEHSFVVSKGFLDVGPDNTVMVIVDTAVADRDISIQKAQAAVTEAEQVLVTSRDREELLRAEAELRRALLEIKVAERSHKAGI